MFQSARNSKVTEADNSHRQEYDRDFFDRIQSGCEEAASIIVPIVLKLVQPKRVVDIGCGRGVWLREFERNGVPEIFGLDGAYVRTAQLLIDPQFFRAVDLASDWHIDRRYDLAVCLEVAEHLPARSAKRFVRTLASAAPLILFSAAVPNQNGLHHINEQWPPYWEALFEKEGYRRLDAVRRYIVNDERVAPWYRQNIFLYASKEAISASPRLQIEEEFTQQMSLDYVDKRVLGHLTSARGILKHMPRMLLRTLKNRIYR